MQISVVGLGWYISAVLVLSAVATSLISYAPPGPSPWVQALPIVFIGGAFLVAVVTMAISRLPSTHWIRNARPVWAGFAAVAATATVLLLLVG
jgi:hypothetical protein